METTEIINSIGSWLALIIFIILIYKESKDD